MTATVSELNPKSRSRSDRERFGDILGVQRAAYLRDGAPSLAKRRSDLKKFKAAMLARRSAIEEAINTDFGHRSRHETALMEILGVVQGIDYLDAISVASCARRTAASPWTCGWAGTASSISRSVWSASSRRGTTPSTCR
jgi:hypothetical protein